MSDLQSEDTWMELLVLHDHGWSIAALAREFGLDWRTARRYATAPGPLRYQPRVQPAELSAAGLAHVERRLAACPDLRATVLHRELRAARSTRSSSPASCTTPRHRPMQHDVRARAGTPREIKRCLKKRHLARRLFKLLERTSMAA